MTLTTEVTDRYDTQTLTELTNVRSPDGTSITTAQVTRAATAISDAFFPRYVHIDYDASIQNHIELAVEGVVALLRKWGNPTKTAAQTKWQQWVEEAKECARAFGGRRRVTPVSTASVRYQHSTPSKVSEPEFDEEDFQDTQPRAPGRVEE